MQNVWDTLSSRKSVLELNVREFLGIQGIIPPHDKSVAQ